MKAVIELRMACTSVTQHTEHRKLRTLALCGVLSPFHRYNLSVAVFVTLAAAHRFYVRQGVSQSLVDV